MNRRKYSLKEWFCKLFQKNFFVQDFIHYIRNVLQDEDSKRFITIYEDRQLPVRVIDQGKSRGIEWQIDPTTLKPHYARELLKRFASGIFIEKQVPFRKIFCTKNLAIQLDCCFWVQRSFKDKLWTTNFSSNTGRNRKFL